MIRPIEGPIRKDPCLDDEDFYGYLIRSQCRRPLSGIESHLSACAPCRQELAELVRILHPETQGIVEMAPEPSPQEIERTLALIQQASQREKKVTTRRLRWYRWGAAAAILFVAVGLTLATILLYQRSRAQTFYAQARNALQEVYAPQSPSELRLDLPFQSTASQRSSPNPEPLEEAEGFFNRALGVREGMRESMLGLGYIHLRRGQYLKAQEAFEGVLGSRTNDPQALLGLGVSRFEEGLASPDPMTRSTRLRSALADFEAVLKLTPESAAARFNRAWVLYEIGRHKEAIQEIDGYLLKDADSIWALKLRNLKTRILMNRAEMINREIFRAAKARDAPALGAMARAAPFRILPAIRSLIIDAIAIEDQPRPGSRPDSTDLRWAAGILASEYGRATGDTGYSRLLSFYDGLDAPQRRAKRDLDLRLEQLIDSYHKGSAGTLAASSASLIRGFEDLKDYWELMRVHQLRGNAAIYVDANPGTAAVEFRSMLRNAELSGDPDLVARSLSAQAAGYIQQHRYDEALAGLSRLKDLAATHGMENWSSYASSNRGGIFLQLNQLDESLREYSSVLNPACRLADTWVLISALENIGVIRERAGQFGEARFFCREAGEELDLLIKEGSSAKSPEVEGRRLKLLHKQGSLALRMRETANAEVCYQEVVRRSAGVRPDMEAAGRIGLAQVYFEENKYEEAGGQVDAVLAITGSHEFPEAAWQARSLKGHLLRQEGKPGVALEQFRQAQLILERMRANISSPDLRMSFFSRRFDPFREAVALACRMKEDPRVVLEQVDRAKAVTLQEYLGAHGGRDRSIRTAVSGVAGADPSGSLPPGIITLEYFLTEERLLVFLSGPHGTEMASRALPSADLTATLDRYLESIRRNDAATFNELSLKLHDELIEPVRIKLESQSFETLVILPDGPLHLLPFGSLRDAGGRYLLERFTLSYAPSRSTLRYCLAMNKNAKFSSGSSALLLDGTSGLAAASDELACVAGIFSKSNRLVGAAELADLDAAAGRYNLIHFSGHADSYRGRPRLLFPAPGGMAGLGSGRIENWKMTENRLVSLLGCSTGVGPLFEGETPWGLVPAFLSAGAPSLLLCLLPIDDVAASNLTAQFYRHLVLGTFSRAAALRQAQVALLRNLGAEAPARPILWAPFVLVGDPR